jgi:glycosyltransferase involved in cell wall biosynthesis
MRILLVSNYYPEHVGGIETVAANLAAGYRGRGHQVRWLAGDIAEAPHVGVADDVPIRVWNGIETLGFPYPVPPPSAISRVSHLVGWSEVVHLHDCLYALNIATFAAARCLKRPVLLTQHVAKVPYPNPVVRGLQSAAYATIGRPVLSHVEQVVFVSEQVRAWFEPRVRFQRPPLVIENGIDTAVFMPLEDGSRAAARARIGANGARPLALFVGRFVEKKGVRLLRPVIQDTPGADWLLIGRKGDVDPTEWDLPNLRVMSPLGKSELRYLYAAADLLVLPSSGEGFPVVAQEAMACGTPALLTLKTASGLPALGEIVYTTTLAGDDLGSAVRGALTDARSGDRRARVAACASQRWGVETMVARYEQELERLLN